MGPLEISPGALSRIDGPEADMIRANMVKKINDLKQGDALGGP